MNSSPLDRVSLKNPVHLLALGFGSGLIRPAPGTWGSLAGTIFGSALFRYFDQKLESGFGIMVDDVLAAGYAVIVIAILRIVGLPC